MSAIYRTKQSRRTGLLLVAPAVVFVGLFTLVPFLIMIWVSFHNWSLITPPKWVGLRNFEKAFSDRQFWVSLTFTLKYTALLTPVLMIGGYLIALLVANNTPLRRVTRTVVFTPVVIGLGASSLLWYWLFATDAGLINKLLIDLGLIAKPIIWLGTDVTRSNFAVIASITWKVIGFGMILFVAAIQSIDSETIEAAKIDGANFWQRIWHIILPLTLKTVLLVTLVSVIGSLLAFDQFYIMTAGQPRNQTATSVFYVYLNSFPYLKLGYGAALSLILAAIILVFTVAQMMLSRRAEG